MLTSSGILCPTEHGLFIILLALVLLISSIAGVCSRRELTPPTYGTMEYRSGDTYNWMPETVHEPSQCEVLFQAAEEQDGVRLEVTESNIQPRLFRGHNCLGKVTVYDGSSDRAAELGDFCGQEVPVFESSGSSVLLVFENNKVMDKDNFKGFVLNYSRINRSGHKSDKVQPSVGAGTVALAVISAAVLYCVLFVVLYRRCRSAQRVRRSLAVSGHAPGEPRVTQTSMQDQTNSAQLILGQGQPAQNSTSPMPDLVTSLGNTSRPGSARGKHRPGRVRHPAGDSCRHPSQPPSLNLLYSSHHSDNCSGYGSDRDEHCQTLSSETVGLIHHLFPVGLPDPSGVFYAGNVDEHGILHPPGDHNYLYTTATPSVVSGSHTQSFIGRPLDDNRRSRESSHSVRSLCPSGRDSPHDSSQGGSSGCCSPYRTRIHSAVVYNGSPRLIKNMDTEGETFTFYGMIDGVSAASAADAAASGGDVEGETSDSEESASSLHQEEDSSTCGPPPTYEDAATGKYSPHFSKH